jgi:hypothetical protein
MKTPLAPRTTNSLVNRSYLSSSTKPSLNFPSTPAACPGKKKAFSSPIATSIINSDPIVTQLLKEQRILENELKVVKEELDTAEQAKKIEAHSRKWLEKRNEEGLFEGNEERIDGELVVLVGKWRGASRGAAEEMFGHVRDRVNRYVGLYSLLQSWFRAEMEAGWADPEPGKKCKRNSKNFKTNGTKKSPQTTTPMTKMKTLRGRMSRRGICMRNMMSILRRRMRNHKGRGLWVIRVRSQVKRM